jgi:hypothetical protein
MQCCADLLANDNRWLHYWHLYLLCYAFYHHFRTCSFYLQQNVYCKQSSICQQHLCDLVFISPHCIIFPCPWFSHVVFFIMALGAIGYATWLYHLAYLYSRLYHLSLHKCVLWRLVQGQNCLMLHFSEHVFAGFIWCESSINASFPIAFKCHMGRNIIFLCPTFSPSA